MEKSELEFLELYIKTFSVLSASKTIAVTRADTKEFLFVSQPLLELLKRKHDHLIGKKLRDLSYITPYIDQYKDLFKNVIQTGLPLSALIAHDFNNNGIKSIKLLRKEPLMSPLTGKVFAVIDEIEDFIVTREFTQFISLLNHSAGIVVDTSANKSISLTKREREIVFLLSLGKSPKHIADFISRLENKILSPATVTAIINKHLYIKFGVTSASQLIEKAILFGFVNTIPDSFIRKSGVLTVLDY